MSNSSQHYNLKVHKGNDKIHGVEKTIPLIFSSKNVEFGNANRNSFTVNLYSPISVPSNAVGAKVGLFSANIWNDIPNILVNENDKLYIEYPLGIYSVIQLSEGLYDFDQLSLAISRELNINGLPPDLFTLVGDSATQKVFITFNYADVQLDFTPNDTFKVILGFNSRFSPPALSSVGEIDSGDNIALFNNINSFLILAPSLVDNGIPINSTSMSVLGEIPITASPNSLITYQANNVLYIQTDHLIGKDIFNLSFRLTDEQLRDIKIRQDFNFLISVIYMV